ncbi:hypothetical protein ACTHGU_08580 [Chitinophagaceae bacterium MMS25-I14]
MVTLDKLMQQLRAAEEDRKRLLKNAFLSAADKEIYRNAHENVLRLQREIASAEGSEFCVPLTFEYEWDAGAPMPHLLHSEHKTYLLFYLGKELSGWDGKTVEVVYSDTTKSLIAGVEFKRCYSAKLGSPNDEVLHGHPLYGKGLDYYEPFIVRNSNWVKELENINKVHAGYRPETWKKLNHYLFPFHDTTFECLAFGFEVTVMNATMKAAVTEYCSRLF